MPWWEDVLDIVGVLALLFVLFFVSLWVRRRILSRRGATFECSLRLKAPTAGVSRAARGWELGIGRYDGETLQWFRVFSFSPRPKATFDRSLVVLTRRKPHGAEAFSIYAGHLILKVRLGDGRDVELAMGERALTGFLAWTEAAPPGHDRLLN